MLTQRPCCGRARPAVSRCPRPPRALAATPDRPQLAVPALAGSAAAGALDPAVLQTLREKVERDEAALTCSRAALRAADRLSHSAATDDMNYGFTRQRLGQYNEAGAGVAPPTPRNALALAGYTFQTEFRAVVAWARAGFKDDGGPLVVGTPAAAAAGGASAAEPTLAAFHRSQLGKLTLSNAGIAAREAARPSVPAPPSIKLPYLALCWALDTLFDGRPLPRLWLLEHVARMPYLAYASMIHLYESLGWWRMGAAIKRIHFAQEWNEFHHLLVMESLGGDRAWVDRFLAGHASLLYFWLLCALWLVSPAVAYNFSELIEAHAVDTYAQFAEENKALLASLPAPAVAVQYWREDADLFEIQPTGGPSRRRPTIITLLDVFHAIRDDEAEHVETIARLIAPGESNPA